MSDYLTQLITRNLDTSAIVRPRPTPLFAPERAVTRPMLEPESLLDELMVETPPLRPARQPLPATQTADNPMPTQADQPQLWLDPLSAIPRHRAVPPPLPVSEPRDDVAQPFERIAPRRRPVPVTPQPLSLPAASMDEPAAHREVASTQPASIPLTPLQLIERVVVSEPASSAESPHLLTPPVIAQPRPVPAPREVQPQSPSSSALVTAQTSLNITASSIQPARRSAQPTLVPTATPEPTIHVTIGRIEVRATPSPPAAKPTRATSPVMSLDDYLRQRAGEGRR